MRVLHLTLNKKWFDMIASGEKKEEYRELKPYWIKRLTNIRDNSFEIVFNNGYGNVPSVRVLGVEITRGYGQPEWGAQPGKEYFVIKLGKIISTNNLKKEVL